jgi:hypothetical protein
MCSCPDASTRILLMVAAVILIRLLVGARRLTGRVDAPAG